MIDKKYFFSSGMAERYFIEVVFFDLSNFNKPFLISVIIEKVTS